MMTLPAGRLGDAHAGASSTLPDSNEALASGCRAAALAFLNESARWGKAELAQWLVHSYAPLAHRRGVYVRRRSELAKAERPVERKAAINDATIARIIREARAEVIATIESTRDAEGGASFAFGMMSSGFVARCEIAPCQLGWRPTSAPRRLAERVLSLFAVDYLARPADYEAALSTCTCGALSFSGSSCSHQSGRRGAVVLSLVPKTRQITLPYFTVAA